MAEMTKLTDAVTVNTARGKYTYSPDNSDPSKGPWPFKMNQKDDPRHEPER